MFNETIQCGDQFSTGSRFGHEGIAQGMRCTYKFGGLVNCEEDNLRGRGDLADLVRRLDAVHSRHIDIEKNDIRLQLPNPLDGLCSVRRLPANVKPMPFEKRTDGGPRHSIIVYHQYAGWHCTPAAEAGQLRVRGRRAGRLPVRANLSWTWGFVCSIGERP